MSSRIRVIREKKKKGLRVVIGGDRLMGTWKKGYKPSHTYTFLAFGNRREEGTLYQGDLGKKTEDRTNGDQGGCTLKGHTRKGTINCRRIREQSLGGGEGKGNCTRRDSADEEKNRVVSGWEERKSSTVSRHGKWYRN